MHKRKRTVVQIVLEPQQKQLIQQYVRYISLKQSKGWTVSSFLSQSIMNLMVDKFKQSGLYQSE